MARTRQYAVYVCDGGPHDIVDPRPDCPNASEHTPGPSGYGAWHEWAAQMIKTHRQSKCPGCGLFLICTRKGPDQ